MKTSEKSRRKQWGGVLWWVLFAAGLIVQLFAPRLEIANRAFVIPAALTAQGGNIRPDEIVAKERRMKFVSALLTTIGAVGLAIHYRGVFSRRARPADERGGSRTGDSSLRHAQ